MEKVSIKGLRSLKAEAFTKQPLLLCCDGKPVALIVPTGDLAEQEIVTPKVTTEKRNLSKMEAPSFTPIPKVRQPFED